VHIDTRTQNSGRQGKREDLMWVGWNLHIAGFLEGERNELLILLAITIKCNRRAARCKHTVISDMLCTANGCHGKLI